MKLKLFLLLAMVAWGMIKFDIAQASTQTICLDTAPGTTLSAALQTWVNSSSGTTEIRVPTGTYPIQVGIGEYVHPTTELHIFGGYTPGTNCSDAGRAINPIATALSGAGGAFTLLTGGSVVIDDITLSGYTGNDGFFAPYTNYGVTIQTYSNAANLIATRFISQNNSTVFLTNGGADSNGLILIDNCLIFDQPHASSNGLPALHIATHGNNATMSNCTISDNGETGLQLDTFDSGQLNVYNTIAVNSFNSDIATGNVGDKRPLLAYSMYYTLDPNALLTPQSNLHLTTQSPGFVNPGGDYHLQSSSPAVNRGTASPSPLLIPPTDIVGAQRISGGIPDMGAYESSVNNQAPLVVTSLADAGAGSLRAVMTGAPANARISFHITSQVCPEVIQLQSALPPITGTMVIDATTQPGWTANDNPYGFDGNLCVWIVTNASVPYAFDVPSTAATDTSLTVQGIEFSGFTDAAIKLEGGSAHQIYGNTFTKNAPELGFYTNVPNHDGIYVTGGASNTVIGNNSDPGKINQFGNATQAAVHIDAAAGGNEILGNVIGMQGDGNTADGNKYGIAISDSPNNSITANMIVNNTLVGVSLSGTGAAGNLLEKNSIGINTSMATAAGNLGPGVSITSGASNNVVGSGPGSMVGGNGINYNHGAGVMIASGTGNTVLGNALADNTGLAIDLGAVGANALVNPQTANLSVANEQQNYPSVDGVFRTALTEWFHGSIRTFANQQVQIDLYASDKACGAVTPGRGNGGGIQGSITVHTDAAGNASFWAKGHSFGGQNLPFPYTVAGVATSTTGHFDTSEIGNCLPESNDMIFRDDLGG